MQKFFLFLMDFIEKANQYLKKKSAEIAIQNTNIEKMIVVRITKELIVLMNLKITIFTMN